MEAEQAAEWLAQARAGSVESLGRVLEACRGYLLLIAQQELEPELQAKGGASDLVQETFLKAHRHFPRFHGHSEAELLAWLRRLLLNNLIDFRRLYLQAAKRRAAKEVSLQEGGSSCGGSDKLAAPEPTPSRLAMKDEQAQALRKAMERLPDDYRAVITPELRRRFQREACAASALDHPNLVPVFEAVEVGPVCVIVSAYCPGITLAQWLAKQIEPVTFRLAAQLLATLAEAVQHAHGRGILHRDLKPSNILLVSEAGEKTEIRNPSSDKEACRPISASRLRVLDFIPKITDFGLAKYLETESANVQGARAANDATRTGAILGTPSYMAPEQAGGKTKQIGPTADVYSLGAILYELLTGRPPFKGDSELDTVLQLQTEEPVPPARLRPKLPRDLETICLKCLQKEPRKRYGSAAELAEDLHRFSNGQPIRARPVSMVERLWRLCRRNPLPSGLVAVAVVLLVIIAVVASVGYLQTKSALDREATATKDAIAQRQAAVEERDTAQLHLYYANMHLAQQAWKAGEIGQLLRLLEQYRPVEGQIDLRGWEWRYLQSRCQGFHCLRRHQGVVRIVSWSPDGRFLASAGADSSIRIWNDLTESEHCMLQGHRDAVHRLGWSPDSQRLASASLDQTIRIWDVAAAKQTHELSGNAAGVGCVAWSPDGKQVLSASAGRVWLYDAVTGKPIKSLPVPGAFSALALHPKGHLLAGGGRRGEIAVWDLESGTPVPTAGQNDEYVHSIAWSPDGRRFAAGGSGMTAKIWSLEEKREPLTLTGHEGTLFTVAWSPDSRRLATSSNDGTVRVWDTESGDPLSTLRPHTGSVIAVAWHPDGQRLATGSSDKTVCVFRPVPEEESQVLRGHQGWVWSVAWSPDGRFLVSACDDDKSVKFWDTQTGKVIQDHSGQEAYALSVSWDANGQRVASAFYNGMVKIWNPTTGEELLQLQASKRAVRSVCWSPDGQFLATGGDDAIIRLWQPARGAKPRELSGHENNTEVRTLSWSPDGKWLASAGSDLKVILWDPVTGQKVAILEGHNASVVALAWSPQGDCLASGSFDGSVKIWNPVNQQEIRELRGHAGAVVSLAWNGQGDRLASGGGDIRLWDTATGQQALTLKGHTSVVQSLAWSRDGEQLASGSWDGTIRIWDASLRKRGQEP